MLTPMFELSQDDDYVTVIVKVPFAKVSDTEIYFEDYDFRFYSKPYYLRLNLPGKVLEDTKGEAQYDSDSNWFKIKMPKANPGEQFEGLDMLTKLLAPRESSAKIPVIEVIQSNENKENEENDYEDEDYDYDWYYEQSLPNDSMINTSSNYGFANRYSGVFSRLREEMNEIIDVKNPDQKSLEERHLERLEKENEDFNEDHYLADYISPDYITVILKYEAPWQKLHHELTKDESISKHELVHLTDEEKSIMRELLNKEYLLKSGDLHLLGLGLVDLIYCYAYQHRTTEAETNVESGWTICKLSPLLSWLEVHSNLKDAVISCMRRLLCYPLFRNWKLALAVLKDTQIIFSLGRKYLLKCLLEVRSILQGTEGHYILNELFVTDYCIWIQKASKKLLKSLSKSLGQLNIEKQDLGFDLEELEMAARIVEEEEEIKKQQSQTMLKGNTVQLNNLSKEGIDEHSQEEDSDDESEEDSDDESETESSDSETEEDSDDETRTEDIVDDCDSKIKNSKECGDNQLLNERTFSNETESLKILQNELEDLSLKENIKR